MKPVLSERYDDLRRFLVILRCSDSNGIDKRYDIHKQKLMDGTLEEMQQLAKQYQEDYKQFRDERIIQMKKILNEILKELNITLDDESKKQFIKGYNFRQLDLDEEDIDSDDQCDFIDECIFAIDWGNGEELAERLGADAEGLESPQDWLFEYVYGLLVDRLECEVG